MNIVPVDKMNQQLFAEWEHKLFCFVYENKRKFTEAEWRWMRYQFEIEHMQTVLEETPQALAADGENVRSSLQSIIVHAPKKFEGKVDGRTYIIKITPVVSRKISFKVEGAEVVDEKLQPVHNMKIRIKEYVIDLGPEGRFKLAFETYNENLQKTQSSIEFEFSVDGINFFPLNERD